MSFGIKFFVVCATFNLFVLFCIGVVLDAVAEPITYEEQARSVRTDQPSIDVPKTARLTKADVDYMVDFDKFPPAVHHNPDLARIDDIPPRPLGQDSTMPQSARNADPLEKISSTFDE